jgi:hypothetical protein
MSQKKYVPIILVRFDNSGNMIMAQDTSKMSSPAPAYNSSFDPHVKGSTLWSAGKTIFELQKNAFTELKNTLQGSSGNSLIEPNSIKVYSNAIQSVIEYNKGIKNKNSNGSGDYEVVFYNQSNGDVDYTEYEKLIRTRDDIKAKLDNINGVPGTLTHEQHSQFINSTYTNTLVAIAVVSLLYMAFIHL